MTDEIMQATMNLLFGVAIVVLYARLIVRKIGRQFHWIYLMKVMVALIWTIVYIFVVASMITHSFDVDRQIIRMAVSFTLAVLLVCAISSSTKKE